MVISALGALLVKNRLRARIPVPMSLPLFQGSRYGVEDIVCA